MQHLKINIVIYLYNNITIGYGDDPALFKVIHKSQYKT